MSVRAANRTSWSQTEHDEPPASLDGRPAARRWLPAAPYRSAATRNVQVEDSMRRLVTALIGSCACAPALLTAQLATPTDWKWRQDARCPAGRRAENGAGLVGLRADAAGLARHDGAWRAALPDEPTARSTATTRSKRRSSCSLVRVAEEYGVFLGGQRRRGLGSARLFGVRAAARWPCRGSAPRAAGQTAPLAAWQRHDGHPAGKAATNPSRTCSGSTSTPRTHVSGEWREGVWRSRGADLRS